MNAKELRITDGQRAAQYLQALKEEEASITTHLAGMGPEDPARFRKEARLKAVADEIKSASKAA